MNSPPAVNLKTLVPKGSRWEFAGVPVRVLSITKERSGGAVIYENLSTQARGWVQGWYFLAFYKAA